MDVGVTLPSTLNELVAEKKAIEAELRKLEVQDLTLEELYIQTISELNDFLVKNDDLLKKA